MAKTNTVKLAEMYTDIKWIKKSLEGNGGPGLIEQTKTNTDFRNQIKGIMTGLTILGGTIGAGIMWLISKIKFKGG